MAVGPHLSAALEEAIRGNRGLKEKWVGVMRRLAGQYGAQGALHYQADYRIDLMLRAMEKETAARRQEGSTFRKDLAFDIQHTLTRYWLLSTYEALRIAKSSEKGSTDEKVLRLHQLFKLVRIPLAKFEIANDQAGKVMLGRLGGGAYAEPEEYGGDDAPGYHPPIVLDRVTGSFGWHLFEAKTLEPVTIYRQQLSDELLALFD